MKRSKRRRKCVYISFFHLFLFPVLVETPISCCAGGGSAGGDVSELSVTGVCEGFSKLNLNLEDQGVEEAKEQD